ncbi:hypothetical protein [Streptomyces noursei]|uniref:hypothetical protein n=1 Tax=Streptomyces noursei TaxID=1971 RepID=UPI00198D9DE9|nr:hypothetical protein [Streptomyces noursei]MCZ1021320.1 hypothetical protein [Streptomyces noursei]GGX55822.1 hypothetical protein GCM10010341_90690 [Streptomyces noursei]
MSTITAFPDLSQPTHESAGAPGQLISLVATSIALTAAPLALFAKGLGATVVHLVVALAVFTAVRLCVALAPYHPPLTDDPERSP